MGYFNPALNIPALYASLRYKNIKYYYYYYYYYYYLFWQNNMAAAVENTTWKPLETPFSRLSISKYP